MKKIPILFSFFLMGSSLSTKAQEQHAFSCTSHSAIIQGISFDYTIGEMAVVSTARNSTLTVTQGFLQPTNVGGREVSSQTSGLDNFASLVKVYPNPSDHLLFIESVNPFNDSFDFQLIDASGKTILSKQRASEISQQKWSLNISVIAAGSYFLMISQQDQQGKKQSTSFKIQKTN